MADPIPAVRILPMSTDEPEFVGKTHEEVQSQFFLSKLPSRQEGRYFYRTKGLLAEPGTVVLFQYKKRIIASAVFKGREPIVEPKDQIHGALRFDVDSIRVFDPVGPEVLGDLWPEEFKRFGNVMAQLNADAYPEFQRQLTGIRPIPTLENWNERFAHSVTEALQRSAEERSSRLAKAPPVPKRVTVTTSVFERNSDVVAEVRTRAVGCASSANALRHFFDVPTGHHTWRFTTRRSLTKAARTP
jgi:hypothetical protein